MKLKKLFALALCLATVSGLLAVTSTQASATEISTNPVHLKKEITKAEGDNRDFNVHLEAYTDGTKTYIPADIVLVLEESGRMATQMYEYDKVYEDNGLDSEKTYYIKNGDSYTQVNWCTETIGYGFFGKCNGWYTGSHFTWAFFDFHWGEQYDPIDNDQQTESGNRVQFYTREAVGDTKRVALIAAANTFVDGVKADAVANNVAHRVSIVSFSNTAEVDIGLEDDIRNNIADVKAEINDLTAAGSSDLNTGLVKAQEAFVDATETQTNNNKIVVVFTYGVPRTATTKDDDDNYIPIWDDEAVGLANSAIGTANSMKAKGSDITIYTVGLGDDVDPTLNILDEQVNTNTDLYRTNAFLHFVSSNFPSASNLTNGGGDNSGIGKGYYLSALDSGSMNAVFGKLTSEFAAAEINLGANTEVRDFTSQYFELKGNVTVSAADYNTTTKEFGEASTTDASLKNITITAVDGGSSVIVKGFDFNTYFVGGNSPKRLEIDFTITPVDGFLGGNAVPTNDYTKSGIFSYDTEAKSYSLVENFEKCFANVPILPVTVTAQPKNVYLLGDLNADNMKNGAVVTYKVGENDTVLDVANLTWQDDFVTTAFAATAQDDLTDDSNYTVDFTVTPTTADTVTDQTFTSAAAKINVFKPTLTYSDYTVYLGGAVPAFAPDSTVWKHGDTVADTATMGAAPTLVDYTYDKSSFTACDTVNFTGAKIGTTDVTSHVTANEFKVHVLYPTAQFKDTYIYLGSSANYANNYVKTTWAHASNDEGAGEGYGDEPQLNITGYDVTAASFTECTNVNVTEVMIGKQNVTQYTSFSHNGTKPGDAEFTVHVYTPTVTFRDTTIYLGNTPNYDDNVASVAWACKDSTVGTNGPGLTYGYAPVAGAFTTCTPVNVTAVYVDGAGTTNYIANVKLVHPDLQLLATDPHEFTVHVLKPTINFQDTTIYLGNPADFNNNYLSKQTIWTEAVNHGKTTTDAGDEPNVTVGYDKDAGVFTGCTDVSVTSVKVGENAITDYETYVTMKNGTETRGSGKTEFTVHVAKPVITNADTTIYLGNTVDLNKQMTEGDNWQCNTETCEKQQSLPVSKTENTVTTRLAPTVDHSFVAGGQSVTEETAYAPTTCTPVTVTTMVTTVVDTYTVTPKDNDNTFTVHVLVPAFTVNTQDLWADLGTPVDLYTVATNDIDAVASCKQSWVYSGSCKGHSKDLPTTDLKVEVTDVYFDNNNTADKHEAITKTDIPVTVTGVAYSINNGATGTAAGTNLTAAENGSLSATLHANTFNLAITNSSAQNGIFKLTEGTSELNKLAVIGNNTTTIGGLYCSVNYALDESDDNVWTWRYNNAVKAENITHSNSGVVATENCSAVVNVTISYGEQDNTKWLSGEAYAINNKSGRVDMATTSMLNFFKKEEGDE